MLDITQLLLVGLAGVAGGFVNAVAGGGTLIIMPTLMIAGLDPLTANGTNRLGILLFSYAAWRNYHHQGYFFWRDFKSITPVILTGSILGGLGAQFIDPRHFTFLVALIMLFIIIINLTGDSLVFFDVMWEKLRKTNRWGQNIFMFLVGLYAGFLQIGAALVMLSFFLKLLNKDLIEANALKAAIILMYTFFLVGIFGYFGHIDWIVGLVLALSCAVGGYLGSCFGMRFGHQWIQRVFLMMVSILTVKLFIDFLKS